MIEINREYLSSLIGKKIKFNEKITNWESYAEPNMCGIVTKFRFDEDHEDPVHAIFVDFSPFEEENHRLQNANYYDKNGNATLTAVEAGFYSPIEDFYIDPNVDQLPFFVVEDETTLDRIMEAVMFFVDNSRFSEEEVRALIKNALDK